MWPPVGTQGTKPQLEGAVRYGVVTDRTIDSENGIAIRVSYPDTNKTSGWIPVMQRNTIGSRDFSVPRTGEQVAVLHMPNGPESGVVLGSVYSTSNQDPSEVAPANLDARRTNFDDQAFIEYDPDNSTLTALFQGPATVKIVGAVSLEIDGAATLTVKGGLTINGVLIDQNGNVTLPAGKTLTADQFAANSGAPSASPHMSNSDGSGNGS